MTTATTPTQSTTTTTTTRGTTSPPTQSTATASTLAQTSDRMVLMLGSLYALVVANSVQFIVGVAGLEVSPPPEVLPLIAATVVIGVAAIPMVRAGSRTGLYLGLGFAALSLIGMGPHKLLAENGSIIAPLAMTGFVFELLFVVAAVRTLRGQQ